MIMQLINKTGAPVKGNRMKQFKIILVTLMLLSFTTLCGAAEKKEKRPPIDITSDSLEATKGDMVFVGNVHAVYGEITIDADKMKILYESESSDKKQDVKEIIATGNVKLTSEKRSAWGDKLVYKRDGAVATLTGKPQPQIKEGDNTFAGDVIKVFFDEDRVEIKGNFKGVVNPDNKQQ